jgi:hypothetical protein
MYNFPAMVVSGAQDVSRSRIVRLLPRASFWAAV